MAETVNLQVDDNMALQDAVIEDKVGLEIILVYKNALLAVFEAEASAHLQQKTLKVVQNGRFQFGFRIVFIRLYAQELQRDGIVNYIARCNLLRIFGS